MTMTTIPIGMLLAATIFAVMLAIEVGYRLGKAAHRYAEKEKVPPVSSMAGAILGLVASEATLVPSQDIATSFPSFAQLLQRLGAPVS